MKPKGVVSPTKNIGCVYVAQLFVALISKKLFAKKPIQRIDELIAPVC